MRKISKQDFAEIFKEARKKSGLSQWEVGKIVMPGKSRSSQVSNISAFERGTKIPSIDRMNDLLEAVKGGKVGLCFEK